MINWTFTCEMAINKIRPLCVNDTKSGQKHLKQKLPRVKKNNTYILIHLIC